MLRDGRRGGAGRNHRVPMPTYARIQSRSPALHLGAARVDRHRQGSVCFRACSASTFEASCREGGWEPSLGRTARQKRGGRKRSGIFRTTRPECQRSAVLTRRKPRMSRRSSREAGRATESPRRSPRPMQDGARRIQVSDSSTGGPADVRWSLSPHPALHHRSRLASRFPRWTFPPPAKLTSLPPNALVAQVYSRHTLYENTHVIWHVADLL